jgi:hypothetical protein
MGGKCVQGPNAGPFVLWASLTQDLSSSATGSSVFDFQGDGANEVIYNDECFLHVYDGRNGSELLSDNMGNRGPRPNSTRTRHEYPVVADVDLDGNSEIIVTANRDEYLRDKCPRSGGPSSAAPPTSRCPPTSRTAPRVCSCSAIPRTAGCAPGRSGTSTATTSPTSTGTARCPRRKRTTGARRGSTTTAPTCRGRWP